MRSRQAIRVLLHNESCCTDKRVSGRAGCQVGRLISAVAEDRPGGYYPSMKTAVLKDEQFVTDADGRRVGVILSLRAYERLRQAQEELADIQAYDAALPIVRAEMASGQFTTLAEYHVKSRTGNR